MESTYAIHYRPEDGPWAVLLVDAETSAIALDRALTWYHSIDMDTIKRKDLTAVNMGSVTEIMYLDADGFAHQVKEDS